MNIGIYDINNVSSLNYKERLSIYKEIGFKEVACYLDEKYMENDENYFEIIKYAKKIGLEVKQVHLDYKISNSICSKDTNEYFDYLEKKIQEGIKEGVEILVVHASKGDNPPLIDEESLLKLDRLLEKYEDKNIFVCFENVRKNDNLDRVISLNRKNLGVCYDLGHAHCYDNEYDLLNKYKNKILCAHLHNNTGSDSHNILRNGDIDYLKIISRLKDTPIKSSCLEVFPPRGSTLNEEEFRQFIIECYTDINR